MSEKHRGTTSRLGYQSLLFTLLLIAPLMYLSGCGSGQTDVGQTNGNSVPVSLNISMPQDSAAASTSGSRFWATVQSWLPSVTSAWAQQQTPTPLSAIQVDVTGPDLAPISTTKNIPPGTLSGSTFTLDLDVPVGPDRVFTVAGFVGTGNPRFQGKSRPITLTSGQAASVEVILTPNTGTVTGRVTSAAPGQPLPGDVSVAVTGTSLTTTTNSDVRYQFTLTGIPQGSQTLTVSAVGFTSTTKTVTAVAGSTVDAGTIALTPLPPIIGTVTGTVTNAGTGARLSDATVTVTGTSLRTTTNSDGNFRLDGVPEGLQTLAVSKSGFTATTRAVTVVAGSTVDAGTIALTPPPPTTGTVTGTVTDATSGAPIPNRVTVAVTGTNLSTTTDRNGNFTLPGVPQGPQTLTVSSEVFNNATKVVTVVAGASVSAGMITLTPIPPTTGTVTGTIVVVVGDQSAPVPNADVILHNLQETLFFTTTTDSDGNFTFTAIPQGPQTLKVKQPGFIDMTKAVTVVAGASVSAGTIALTPFLKLGVITGTVINASTSAPIGGVFVGIPGRFENSTDSKGNFVAGAFPQGPQTLTFAKDRFITTTKAVTVFGGLAVSVGTIALEPVQ